MARLREEIQGECQQRDAGEEHPLPTPPHAPSSASPVCLDTTEKLGEVNVFVLLFFSSAICNLQRDEWDESIHFIHSPGTAILGNLQLNNPHSSGATREPQLPS